MHFQQGCPLDFDSLSQVNEFPGSSVAYEGYCQNGVDDGSSGVYDITDTDKAIWAVKKIDYAASSAGVLGWSWVRDGSGEIAFNAIWDSRASLTFT